MIVSILRHATQNYLADWLEDCYVINKTAMNEVIGEPLPAALPREIVMRCRRCDGTGQVLHHGRCFTCKGLGQLTLERVVYLLRNYWPNQPRGKRDWVQMWWLADLYAEATGHEWEWNEIVVEAQAAQN
jgi:hypothetical protein